MAKSGPNPEMQFRYWDLKRRGMTQSEIAGQFKITRQAVSRSIRLHERDLMYRLLGTARMSGSLVEWFDASRGILIGITPQLGNLPFLLLLDVQDRIRIFHDQSRNDERDIALSTLDQMKDTLKDAFGMDLRDERSFSSMVRKVYEG